LERAHREIGGQVEFRRVKRPMIEKTEAREDGTDLDDRRSAFALPVRVHLASSARPTNASPLARNAPTGLRPPPPARVAPNRRCRPRRRAGNLRARRLRLGRRPPAALPTDRPGAAIARGNLPVTAARGEA